LKTKHLCAHFFVCTFVCTQTHKHTIKYFVDKSIKHFVDKSIKHFVDKSIKQFVDKSIKQIVDKLGMAIATRAHALL
jgi:hypothetical protein